MSAWNRQRIWAFLKQTYAKWNEHEAPRLGAALAFYTVLSLAPLLVLVIAIAAFAFGEQRAQLAITAQARDLIGENGAAAVHTMLTNSHHASSGILASILAIVTLLFGASGVFTELRSALNKIWDVQITSASGFIGMIKEKIFSFGMVLSVGFLLLVSLVVSALLAVLGTFFTGLLPIPAVVLETLNFVVSLAVVALLFALIFHFVPETKVAWKDVWVGSVATAILFTIGKSLLGLYLGKASPGSAYGAAGSFVVTIVWVYYSAQIFYFGAEFTRAFSDGTHPAADERQASLSR